MDGWSTVSGVISVREIQLLRESRDLFLRHYTTSLPLVVYPHLSLNLKPVFSLRALHTGRASERLMLGEPLYKWSNTIQYNILCNIYMFIHVNIHIRTCVQVAYVFTVHACTYINT